MSTPSTIRIKRRMSGDSGPPSSLSNAEIAFNEINNTLYYGKGSDINGNATEIIPIGGTLNSLMQTASLSSISNNNIIDTQEYIIINVGGNTRYIRLYDVT
jgi:ATP-dependent protease ClpP protease subunit